MKLRVNIETLLFPALAVGAAYIFHADVSAFTGARETAGRNVQYIDALPGVPYSLAAVERVLLTCDRAMAVPVFGLQPKSRRQATARTCAGFAQQVTALMPSHGFAHLIAARGAETSILQTNYLNKSIQHAPYEGWLAERRFVLGINADALNDQTLQPDIATLLTTQSGATLLARYYLHRPTTRALIAASLDLARQSDQQRFANILAKGRVAR